jgi:hypothetical protein
MGRRSLLVGLTLVLLGAVVVVALVLRDRKETPARVDLPADPVAAASSARAACAELEELENLIDVDAPADRVREVLDRGVERARDAADQDTKWVPLAAAAQALDVAIDADDARAALVGIRGVRSECGRTDPAPTRSG